MKSISFVAMKPSCRIPIAPRNSTLFGLPLVKSKVNFLPKSSNYQFKNRNFRTCTYSILSLRSILKRNQRPFSALPRLSWGQSRVFSSSSCQGGFTERGCSVVASVASDVRNFSSAVETRINDKNFERIYVQGGINVKPLVVERTRNDEDERTENVDSSEVRTPGGEEEEAKVLKTKAREESQIEKEAWRLLQNVVVTYCGSPVGTLAANDPNDKLPLNYDQVFIRDFVPSALAFLLKGETEIVRNFLLHTLQLQVFFMVSVLVYIILLCLFVIS